MNEQVHLPLLDEIRTLILLSALFCRILQKPTHPTPRRCRNFSIYMLLLQTVVFTLVSAGFSLCCGSICFSFLVWKMKLSLFVLCSPVISSRTWDYIFLFCLSNGLLKKKIQWKTCSIQVCASSLSWLTDTEGVFLLIWVIASTLFTVESRHIR